VDSQKQILQTGLYTKDAKEAEAVIGRVTQFNLENIGSPVKLDVIPYEEGDQFVAGPHYKFRFLFPNRKIQERFWTA
jgi:hypothetical protein